MGQVGGGGGSHWHDFRYTVDVEEDALKTCKLNTQLPRLWSLDLDVALSKEQPYKGHLYRNNKDDAILLVSAGQQSAAALDRRQHREGKLGMGWAGGG